MEGTSVLQRFLRGALGAAVLVPLVLAVLPSRAAAQELTWTPSIYWNSYLGGGTLPDGGVDPTPNDELESLAVNAQGEVFVTGHTAARSFPASPADAGLPTGTWGRDVYVARFAGDGQTLRWARVFGGTGEDFGGRLVLGPGGEVYVVGTTASAAINVSPTQPATLVAPFLTRYHQGRRDAFLAKLSPEGALLWFMYLGSSHDDFGRDIVLGPPGSNVLYIVGQTGLDDGFGGNPESGNTPEPFPPGNAESNVRFGSYEAFVSQVDVSLPNAPSVRWTRIIGSAEIDIAYAVAVQENNVYVGGWMGDLVQGGLFPLSVWGSGDYNGFVARLTNAGEVTWFTYVGGSGDDDDVRAILPRPAGGVVLVGNTDSSNFARNPDGGTPGGTDVYVLPMSVLGVEGRGLRVGGSGNDRIEGQAAIDGVGNVYLGGRTFSLTGTGLAHKGFDSELASSAGNTSDGFIAMVNPAVTERLWASYVGGLATGGQPEWVRAVAAGERGQITFGGTSNAPNLLKHFSGADTTLNGGLDGFVFRAEVDILSPEPGTVTAEFLPEGGLRASWSGFTDPESGIIDYEWAVGYAELGQEVQSFRSVGPNVNSVTLNFQPQPQQRYFVTVRAKNGVGHTRAAFAGPLVPGEVPPDAGTPDAGSPDGGTGRPDAGTDAGTGGDSDAGTGGDDEDAGGLPPLGWSCASGGGPGALALTGLLTLAVLLARRRERPDGARTSRH